MSGDESRSETGGSQPSYERKPPDPGPKNYDFVQVSRQYMKQLRELTRKSPVACEILMYLVQYMGRTNNAVVASYGVLSEITGTSRATVGRAIKLLKTDNWIETVRIGTVTAYAVNARVFWQTHRNQRQYAIFSATVVASSTEQDADYAANSQKPLKKIPVIDDAERPTVRDNDDEPLPPPDQQDLPLE